METELLLQQKPFHSPLLSAFSPCCVRGVNPGISGWLGQLPGHPCSPLACASGLEVRASPPDRPAATYSFCWCLP